MGASLPGASGLVRLASSLFAAALLIAWAVGPLLRRLSLGVVLVVGRVVGLVAVGMHMGLVRVVAVAVAVLAVVALLGNPSAGAPVRLGPGLVWVTGLLLVGRVVAWVVLAVGGGV